MSTRANRIKRYYDGWEDIDRDLTQGRVHQTAIKHTIRVLEYYFLGQGVGIPYDINFYQTADAKEKPVSPDIAVVDGLVELGPEAEENPSYWIGEDGPPPRVIIEVSSEGTWEEDLKLDGKRGKYFSMRVGEYFVFDPNRRTIWKREWRDHNRLTGWRRNPINGEYELLEKEDGRLWSDQLQSYLMVEGNLLQLYTQDGQLRLTEAEARYQQLILEQRRTEMERERYEAERQRAETERQRAEAERQQREAAEQQAQAERQRYETERLRAEVERQRYETEWLRAETERQQREAVQQQAEMERQQREATEQRLAKLLEELRKRGDDPDKLV